MAAPTSNAEHEKSSCQMGAVHTWRGFSGPQASEERQLSVDAAYSPARGAGSG